MTTPLQAQSDAATDAVNAGLSAAKAKPPAETGNAEAQSDAASAISLTTRGLSRLPEGLV